MILGHASQIVQLLSHVRVNVKCQKYTVHSSPADSYVYNVFLSVCLLSEIHRVRRYAGSGEEGPADTGGLPGAAGETAGAQDEELFGPE